MHLKSHLEGNAGGGNGVQVDGDGELALTWNAKDRVYPTFLIDCASGKPLPWPGPSPLPPQRPHLGPIAPHMETYILFCWDLARSPLEVSLQCGEVVAQTGKGLSKGTQELAPSLVRHPKSKTIPCKSFLPMRVWGIVKGSLKTFCSCICGQED